jgi:hypothetical protein
MQILWGFDLLILAGVMGVGGLTSLSNLTSSLFPRNSLDPTTIQIPIRCTIDLYA